jgi:lipopolysaccharide transport system ATP-binding protein
MSSDSNLAVRIQGLSKQYPLGRRRQFGGTLGETLVGYANFRQRRREGKQQKRNAFVWALRDVSLDIHRGDVLGVIGGNGAGKSTLLKVLSRITYPTKGRAEIHGRMSSLLEVGTGFHPELSGRENVYLNAAILGMPRRDIAGRFDEIIEFAELRQFVDTAVKHYSSGMYLRLAFSVAAHLQPDILLVDEVLAVGDLAFQKKCLGKLGEVAREGRTVIFVSHNLAAVTTLCKTGLVLEKGKGIHAGRINEAVGYYVNRVEEQEKTEESVEPSRSGLRVSQVRFVGAVDGAIAPGDESVAEFTVANGEPFWKLQVLFVFRDAENRLIFRETPTTADATSLAKPGLYKFRVGIPPLWLSGGLYSCYVKLAGETIGGRRTAVSDNALIRVSDPIDKGYRQHAELLSPHLRWEIERASSD